MCMPTLPPAPLWRELINEEALQYVSTAQYLAFKTPSAVIWTETDPAAKLVASEKSVTLRGYLVTKVFSINRPMTVSACPSQQLSPSPATEVAAPGDGVEESGQRFGRSTAPMGDLVRTAPRSGPRRTARAGLPVPGSAPPSRPSTIRPRPSLAPARSFCPSSRPTPARPLSPRPLGDDPAQDSRGGRARYAAVSPQFSGCNPFQFPNPAKSTKC